MAVSSRSAKVTLPSDTQILITREFDAPRQHVFRAWTTPELITRWWSARRGTVTLAEVDLRPRGTWRYVMVTDGGVEVGFHGEYHEVVENERIVSTEVFEGMPGSGVLVTTTFTERDGRTTLSQLTDAPSREVRDAIVGSGMEAGMHDAMDLLEEVAISLA